MAQAQRSDSTLVTFFPASFDSIALARPHYLDTTTFHANQFDPLENNYTIYSTLSNVGLPHHAMRFNSLRPIGFDMSLHALAQYIRTDKDLKTYLSLLPYSKIRYVMTTRDKEQHLNFQFGRQIYQGLFLSFEYNINYSPGEFTNCKAENNYIWVNTLYTTPSHRYSVLAYWFRNKIDVQENGGICYDSIYINHLESDNGAILTNLTNASNYVKVSGAGFTQAFNILPQDSTRQFSLGRINHSFRYQRNQLFYKQGTTDTTVVHAFQNSLTWNTLGYQKYDDNVPFYAYAGVNYDFYRIKENNYVIDSLLYEQNYSQVILHGGVVANLFGLTTITGHAQLVTLGYQIGDFDVRGRWRQRFGRHNALKDLSAVFDIDLKRQSSSWFEQEYYSKQFNWKNDFHPATYLTMNLYGQYKGFRIGVKNTTINDLIYFGTDAKPTQHDGVVNISEIYGSAAISLWRFRIEGFFALNTVSNSEVMHLPLFQSRLKVSYAQPIFKKAAILQPSITVQYFTRYYADAYMPALRTFYLQNDVMIGNYPFIDLDLTINVKKADIFVQYNNMFLLTGNYNAFIAPHYPMRTSKFFFGINWRLFN